MKIINGIKMFNTQELASMLDVTDRTINKLRSDGLLRSVYLGKKVYTSEQSLSDYLNGVTQKPKTEIVEE